MTSAYLDRPTRQWAEAQVTYTENSKTMAACLRTAIEGAEEIAKSLHDRSDGDSRDRADELAEAIDGLIDPDGTWFQSAMAERNSSSTTISTAKPRQALTKLTTPPNDRAGSLGGGWFRGVGRM